MQILGLLGMYFDAAVHSSIFHQFLTFIKLKQSCFKLLNLCHVVLLSYVVGMSIEKM